VGSTKHEIHHLRPVFSGAQCIGYLLDLMPVVNTTQLLAHLRGQTAHVRRTGIADLAENFATQGIGADVRLIDDGVDDRQVGAAGRAFAGVFIPSAAQIGGFTDQFMHPAWQSAARQIAKRDNACTDLYQIIVGLIRVGHGHPPFDLERRIQPSRHPPRQLA
jgi:hypothetical protein